MGSADFAEEIDCGSFFDQIDDLIDFPADNGCGLSSGADDFPNIWSNPSGCLPGSDPIFTGNNGNSASDLSAELSVPVSIILFFIYGVLHLSAQFSSKQDGERDKWWWWSTPH